jgi:AI-2 transport protein TqsA
MEHRLHDSDLSAAGVKTLPMMAWLLSAVVVILAGWSLRAMAPVLIPITFSIFLAMVVWPLDRWVAHRLPVKLGWLGHVAAMAAILLALAAFVGTVWIAARQVVTRFPAMSSGFGQRAGAAQDGSAAVEGAAGFVASVAHAPAGSKSGLGGVLSQLAETLGSAGGSLARRLADWVSGFAMEVIQMAGTTLGALALVLFLTLLMLGETRRWRNKLFSALNGSARDEARESVSVIAALLRRYLLARTVLGLLTAALYVGALWLFGVDLLIVWGLLAFVLNFIPTVGSLIAGGLPVLYAFFQKDPATALMVGAVILFIEQVMGNYVDPRVGGPQVSLSPLVALIALVLWGWLWGVPGAILAAPVTIAMMISFAHVEHLRPVALFLSNERDMRGLDRIASSPGS